MDNLPAIAFGVAFCIPFGFSLGLLCSMLVGVNLIKVVRAMRGHCDCHKEEDAS